MNRKSNVSFRFSIMAFWLVSSSLVSLSVVAQDSINYTCDVNRDYIRPKIDGDCPIDNIQDNTCDNPNHGGTNELCVAQDCIDCNFHCQAFAADCFGCLNAVGCYYCAGDATCQNSNLYTSGDRTLSCNSPEEFFLGGVDDPDETCISSKSLTQDPLSVANDWAYKMIKVDQVWSDLNYTGKGIRIRINDGGVDVDNLDFDGRFDEANSCEIFKPTGDPVDDHGTKIAGILAGNANNSRCAAGIAYESTFSSCNVLAEGNTFDYTTYKLEGFDISQNSVGIPACLPEIADDTSQGGVTLLQGCPFTVPESFYNSPCDAEVCDFNNQDKSSLSSTCENAIIRHCTANFKDDETACLDFLDVLLYDGKCDYDRLPQSGIDSLAKGVTQGRNGKGIVYVYASGDAFYTGEDINMGRWTSSRYTITVGAVGKDGLHADYSTPGAALHVVGPAGDIDDASHIMTTGLGGTCINSGMGTSYAAPIVSGVIALMLEARPELTWRDVQGILAVTSTQKTDPKDSSKTTNKAGFTHSNWYGFGIIDAKKAVDKALTWNLWTPEYQAIGESEEENQPISNNGTEYVSKLEMSSDYKGFTSESVVVLINLQHYNRGDLELTLVSPGGTQSTLHPGRRPENNQIEGDQRWKLMTVRNWGEDPTGTWTLKIRDLVEDNTITTGENKLRQWKLVVYGRTGDGQPPVLTVESPSPSMAPTSVTTSNPPSSDDGDLGDDTKRPTVVPGLTVTPTVAESQAPVVPTDPPRRALPPFNIIKRPTVIVKGWTVVQEPDIETEDPDVVTEVTDLNPGSTQPTGPVNAPGLSAVHGGNVIRPTYILSRDSDNAGRSSVWSSSSVWSFRSFGVDESKEEPSDRFSVAKLVQNLSLMMEGVSENIPREFWPSIQTALEQHTSSVVNKVMPSLHFESEINIVSVTVNEPAPSRHTRRSLRPDKDIPSVTIVYDELIHFEHVPGTENFRGVDLVGIAFQDTDDREAFVVKIHKELDDDLPVLRPFVSVSSLIPPPTIPYASASTKIAVPKVSGDSSEISDSTSKTSTIVWSVVGVGILCATALAVALRRRS